MNKILFSLVNADPYHFSNVIITQSLILMEIVQKKSFKVIGIKVVAEWEELWREMPKAWERFINRNQEISNRISDYFIDISLEKKGELYTQLICAEVSEVVAVPEKMVARVIPAQQYIHFRHERPVEKIAASFGKMYDWARDNGYAAESFKLDIGYTQNQSERWHDLYIKIMD